MANAIVIQTGDARRAVAQMAAISTRENSQASSATLTTSLMAMTITRRAVDGVEESADMQEKAVPLYYGFARKSPAVRSRAAGSRVKSFDGVSKRTRSAAGEEDDQGHHRLLDDRGWRPRHGWLIRRQGQLGASAAARYPPAARANSLHAGGRQRRLGLQRLQARCHRADVRGARLGVADRAHWHRRPDRGHPRRRSDAVLVVRETPAGCAVPGREGSGRDEDRTRPPRRRLPRDAPAESVLCRRIESNARQAAVGRQPARRDSPA